MAQFNAKNTITNNKKDDLRLAFWAMPSRA